MKRTWVTVKQLAEQFGVDQETVYRAYRTGKIPGSQMGRNIRFDLDEVHRVMRKRAEAMPNSQCAKQRATGGESRRRAQRTSPRSVRRGRKTGAFIAGRVEDRS
jgi:excisionase family DNA binding protein